jgi:hypothetical protein
MKNLLSYSFLFFIFFPAFSQEIPSSAIQIKTALMAAPEEKQDGAKIYGYTSKGEWTVLRKGTNDMICISDDPMAKGFSVSCYNSSAEPFMERGRQLKKAGKSFQEIFDVREAEGKSGKLKLPKDGSILFVLTAEDENYNPKTGEVKDTYLRYVVYIPWATSESTGLPLKAYAPGMPWIMDPGTHRAHIMISPPRN